MRHLLLPFATAGLLTCSLAGCVASGQVHSSASVTAPDLVYINPSVQVIADYDEPIFYSSNYYWRADGGVWYRSSTYTSGWVRAETAPAAIQQIDHPSAYVHYHTPAVEAAAHTSAAARHDEHVEAHDRHDDERKDERKDEREEDHKEKAPKGR